jgi:hypothetical protein
MDEYDIIYIKNKKLNTYNETSFSFIYDKKDKKVSYKNLGTKEIQGEVIESVLKDRGGW